MRYNIKQLGEKNVKWQDIESMAHLHDMSLALSPSTLSGCWRRMCNLVTLTSVEEDGNGFRNLSNWQELG